MANALDSTVSILTSGWLPANTGNITPTIDDISDVKRTSGDSVLIYESSNVPGPNSIGTSSRKRKTILTISIRTFTSRAQLTLLVKEVYRILDTKQTNPFSDLTFDISEVVDELDRSELSVKLWRKDLKWELSAFNESR